MAAATSAQIATGPELNPNPDWAQGYGFQFWRGRHDSFRADGAFGQFCIVVPAADLVVAMTSGTGPMHQVLHSLWNIVLTRLQGEPLPADPAARLALTERLAGLSLTPRAGAPASELEAELAGAEFAVEANPFGFESLRLEFAPRGGSLVVCGGRGRRPRSLKYGRGVWRTGSSALMPEWRGQPIAASGAWPRPDRLELDVCLFANAFRYRLTFDFSGPELCLSARVNVAFGPTDRGEIRARRAVAAVHG